MTGSNNSILLLLLLQEENKIKDVIDSDQHLPLDELPSPVSDLSSSDFPDFSDDSYNTFSDEESTHGHDFLPNSESSDLSFKGPLEIAGDSGAMNISSLSSRGPPPVDRLKSHSMGLWKLRAAHFSDLFGSWSRVITVINQA